MAAVLLAARFLRPGVTAALDTPAEPVETEPVK
jgi:hypothetical protein